MTENSSTSVGPAEGPIRTTRVVHVVLSTTDNTDEDTLLCMEVGNPTVVLPRSKDFPNDLQVFLEIGDDVEGAKFGPYPRRFIEHFSGAVKGNLYSMERNGELDGLAEVTLPFIENGVELKFTGAMFRPIDRYLTNARFDEQKWLSEGYPQGLVHIGENDPQRFFRWMYGKDDFEVDLNDVWILADFLVMIDIENAIMDIIWKYKLCTYSGDFQKERPKYKITDELLRYCFKHSLFQNQFGRVVLWVMQRDLMDYESFVADPDTRDGQTLPGYLEDLLNNVKRRHLGQYAELSHLLLIHQRRPPNLRRLGDSIANTCGVCHSHSRYNLQCDDVPASYWVNNNDYGFDEGNA